MFLFDFLQPTALKSRFAQPGNYVRALFENFPCMPGLVVFYHYDDRPVVQSELPG